MGLYFNGKQLGQPFLNGKMMNGYFNGQILFKTNKKIPSAEQYPLITNIKVIDEDVPHNTSFPGEQSAYIIFEVTFKPGWSLNDLVFRPNKPNYYVQPVYTQISDNQFRIDLHNPYPDDAFWGPDVSFYGNWNNDEMICQLNIWADDSQLGKWRVYDKLGNLANNGILYWPNTE